MNCVKDNSAAAACQENQQVVVLELPYGELRIKLGDAQERAAMKARELCAMTALLLADEGQFAGLPRNLKDGIYWMMNQAASELDQLLDQVTVSEEKVAQ